MDATQKRRQRDDPHQGRAAGSPAWSAVRTLRPHQWVKNLFVLAPLVFSKHLLDASYALRSVAAALAFCALSGAVYTLNDLRDAPADRAHPIKARRPIAAGELGERAALALAATLAATALALGFLLSPSFALVALVYLAVNIAYTVALKRVAFVDVGLIAAGFLLRVIAGATAISVQISFWLLGCTALLASLLGFGKRAHELLVARKDGRDPRATRSSLAGYGVRPLRWVIGVLAAATLAVYALYTQDSRTVEFFHTRRLIWTLPLAGFGIARFVVLALFRPRLESPTEAILRDGLFLLNLAVWSSAVLIIIYANS